MILIVMMVVMMSATTTTTTTTRRGDDDRRWTRRGRISPFASIAIRVRCTHRRRTGRCAWTTTARISRRRMKTTTTSTSRGSEARSRAMDEV